MAVMGIGTTSRVTVEDVRAIINAARGRLLHQGPAPIQKLASLDRPSINGVLQHAAETESLELILLSLDRLREFSHLCATHSGKSMRQYGIPSVAEAAALAAAADSGRLIIPRFCGRNTTASIAG